MSRTIRTAPALALLVIALAWVAPRVSGQAGQPSTKNGEWPMYTADLRGSKYSPLDANRRGQFQQARSRVAVQDRQPRRRVPSTSSKARRSMVKGVLYTTAGTRRSVVALDAKTGELMWTYSLREGRRAGVAPRQLSGRGVAYWTDGKGDERVLFVTTGYRLVALNAKTGQPIPAFGKQRHRRSEGRRRVRHRHADRPRDR